MIKSLGFSILAGLLIAVPLGSNGIICIKFSLDKGFLAGLVSGLGESTVVGFYAWLVISSADAAESFLNEHQLRFRFLSGLILLMMGIQRFFSKKNLKKSQVNKKYLTFKNSSIRFLSIYLFSLSIALINPMTIVSLLALISSHFNLTNNFLIVPTVLGFVFGTAIWWLMLSGTVSYFRTKINRFLFGFINYSSGLFLVIFGLKSIFN